MAPSLPRSDLHSRKTEKNVSLEGARQAIPKVLAGWNVTFSPSSPGTSASRTSATARANRRRLDVLPSIFDGSRRCRRRGHNASGEELPAAEDALAVGHHRKTRKRLRERAAFLEPRRRITECQAGSRRLRVRAGSTRVASTTSTATPSLVVFGREMLDVRTDWTERVPGLVRRDLLTPFENAKAFLEAGVDEFGETDRSTSASLDAAESAFRVRGGVSVEFGSFSFRAVGRCADPRRGRHAHGARGASGGGEEGARRRGGQPPGTRVRPGDARRPRARRPRAATPACSGGHDGSGLRGGGAAATSASATSWFASATTRRNACGLGSASGAASS